MSDNIPESAQEYLSRPTVHFQPPRKNHTFSFSLCFFFLVMLAFFLIVGVSQFYTNTSSQPSKTPVTRTHITLLMGDAAEIDGWDVQVQTATFLHGTSIVDALRLRKGQVYLQVVVRVENTGADRKTLRSNNFQLKDTHGVFYTQVKLSNQISTPNGSMLPQSVVVGNVSYIVPQDQQWYVFSFQTSTGDAIAEWEFQLNSP